MENLQLETAYENEYLEKVLILAKEQLKQAQEVVSKKQLELVEIKKEIRENRIINMYNTDDFEDLLELNQSSMLVTEIVADCDKIKQKINCLENLIESPYFARIDFCFEGEEVPEKIYIGRLSLSEEYISGVLPELGERNIVSMVFEDILHMILKENIIQPKRKFLEKMVSNSPYREKIKRSIEFKMSERFKQILDQFVLDVPRYEMEFRDIYFTGQRIAEKEEMKNFVCQHTELPLAIRLEQLENRILEKGLENKEEYLDKIIQKIVEYKEKGFESICLICKTREACKHLFLKLKSKIEVQFITDDSVKSLQGTLILPSYLAKGLEFDAVIICDANAQNYSKEGDKNLLYMECTRALHSLSLFCIGESDYA